jgi:molybdopterin molybdotransferase
VATVTFPEARERVLREVRAACPTPSTQIVPLLEAAGRVLAEDAVADRDYPPVARSARDGYAIQASSDAPKDLRVIGEVRAGESFEGEVTFADAVEIMTGAPVPRGANAVVMVEHVRLGNGLVSADHIVAPGDAISPQGSEARRGEVVVARGRPLDFASIAVLATVGKTEVPVYQRPTVAILATGDEIVEAGESPKDFQIRNSNAYSLAVQVARAGGVPEILPVARDNFDSTGPLIERGLESGLLLISGGVSAGKYDLVERVLAERGAEFYFDRVRIQPGQPLVFGKARGTFFFGLPGNPLSTMVTFEAIARLALELLAGHADPQLPIAHGRLSEPVRQKPGPTRFLPAFLDRGGMVKPVRWAGSGDVGAAARANAFLVTDPDREFWTQGEWISVLLK